jgi:hypothetical protein
MKVRKLQNNDILQDVFFDKNVQEDEGGIPENLKSIKTLKKLTIFIFNNQPDASIIPIYSVIKFYTYITHFFFLQFQITHSQKPARDTKHQKSQGSLSCNDFVEIATD